MSKKTRAKEYNFPFCFVYNSEIRSEGHKNKEHSNKNEAAKEYPVQFLVCRLLMLSV